MWPVFWYVLKAVIRPHVHILMPGGFSLISKIPMGNIQLVQQVFCSLLALVRRRCQNRVQQQVGLQHGWAGLYENSSEGDQRGGSGNDTSHGFSLEECIFPCWLEDRNRLSLIISPLFRRLFIRRVTWTQSAPANQSMEEIEENIGGEKRLFKPRLGGWGPTRKPWMTYRTLQLSIWLWQVTTQSLLLGRRTNKLCKGAWLQDGLGWWLKLSKGSVVL